MGKVVVTGPTGAIGRALINEAIEDGQEVLAIVHRASVRADELSEIAGCRVLRADLDEYDHALELMKEQQVDGKGFDMFFHLAWRAPFGDDRDNLNIQLNNVQASLAAVRLAQKMGCHTFIGAGSQAEYGRTEGVLSPDTPTHPETGYGISKLCAGQMTRLLCEQIGLRHIWTRILSVYGPHDRKETLISTAVIDMLKDKETFFTPCDQVWDYIYSKDAARAVYIAGKRGKDKAVYIIGSGEGRKLAEYIRVIARLTGYTKEIGFGKRPYNDKQVMYLKADISDLKSDTGFESEVRFEEGAKRLVEYYKKQGYGRGK